MGFYGLGSGGWFLMVPLLLAENLGVENIASSYGLVRLFQSITKFCGPIINHCWPPDGQQGCAQLQLLLYGLILLYYINFAQYNM